MTNLRLATWDPNYTPGPQGIDNVKIDRALTFGMPKMVFFKSFTKFGWVCGALLEFKSRPKLDEGIFESYVHLNLVVLGHNI